MYAGEWEALRLWFREVSIAELAARSGLNERTLRDYRLGNRRPSPKAMKAIEAALAGILDERE